MRDFHESGVQFEQAGKEGDITRKPLQRQLQALYYFWLFQRVDHLVIFAQDQLVLLLHPHLQKKRLVFTKDAVDVFSGVNCSTLLDGCCQQQQKYKHQFCHIYIHSSYGMAVNKMR